MVTIVEASADIAGSEAKRELTPETAIVKHKENWLPKKEPNLWKQGSAEEKE